MEGMPTVSASMASLHSRFLPISRLLKVWNTHPDLLYSSFLLHFNTTVPVELIDPQLYTLQQLPLFCAPVSRPIPLLRHMVLVPARPWVSLVSVVWVIWLSNGLMP